MIPSKSMLKVNCEACGAPYEVDPRRVPASGLKMRCPACGASVHVLPEGAAASPPGGDFELDLPAPKPAAKKHKGTQVGLGMPTLGSAGVGKAPPADDPFGSPATGSTEVPLGLRPGLTDELSDLPSPKRPDLSKSKGIAELDGLDLPAPKVPSKPAAKPGAGRIAPAFDDGVLSADLPAPKGRGPIATPISDVDLPAPKAGLAGLADLPAPKAGLADLPAPKHAAANTAMGFTDLPAPKAGLADLPAPKELNLTDLPAPKGMADLPAAKGQGPSTGTMDLPSPGGFDLDMDLPAPKARPAGGFKPNSPPAAKPAAAPAAARAASMPKDSLAVDPQPFYASGKMAGPLSDLDDFVANEASKAELPAPQDLPRVKPAAQPSKGTAFGIGGGQGLGSKMAKDSLDLPGGAQGFDSPIELMGGAEDLPAPADLPAPKHYDADFEPQTGSFGLPQQDDFGQFGGMQDLPAPNDLPVVKQPGVMDLPAPMDLPTVAKPGVLDLPAPNDLPRSKVQPTAGTAMGIGPMVGNAARAPQPAAPTDLGIGPMMLDASLDLPPSAPANQGNMRDFGGDFDLPPARGTGAGAGTFGDFGGKPATLGSSQAFDMGLDLPPARSTQDQSNSLIDLSTLGMPGNQPARNRPANSFGSTMDLTSDDLELPTGGSNVLSLPTLNTQGGALPLPSMGDLDLFGDAAPKGNAPRGQTIELDGMFELGGSVALDTQAGVPKATAGGASFGELDFGLSPGDAPAMPRPMPMPIPVAGGSAPGALDGVEAELLGAGEAPAPTKKKKKKASAGKAIPAWIWPIVMLLLIGGTGVGLGLFTEHGYFGVYFVERLLAAGDPVRVGAAIESAEKQAKTDTYVDVRKSLVTLSDARNEAGLNRELLARSLLHEALYQVRFGEDAQSAQRSVTILSRVMERGGQVQGLTLARAADMARRGDLSQANTLLKQVPLDNDPYRSLVTGEVALLDKKPDQALKAFSEAEKNGGARALWGKARALMALDKREDAEAAAKATLALSPRHTGALVLMAELALERGDTTGAIEFTRKATGGMKIDGMAARPPKVDMTRAWALMGKIEEKLEHPKEAQAAYERALASDPLRVDVLIGSGRMLMRLARAQEALSRFDSAVSAKPSEKPGTDGKIPAIEASTGAVQALLTMERPQEAMQRINAIKRFDKDPDMHLWLGHVLTALEKWEEAEAAFKKSIDLAPDRFAGYVALSQLLFKRDRPEEAARTLTEATGKVKDSAEVRRMLGWSELNRHHLPEAIHQFEAALHFDGRDSSALHGLTVAMRKTGNIDGAEKALDRLEKADPSFPSLALERGQLLEIRGKYEDAIANYRKALTDRPTDTDLRLRLGAALVTAGHVDEADGILKQVLKERPSSAEAEHFVGRVLFARKDTAQAVQRFQHAVAIDPMQAEYFLYLAWGLLEQNNLSGALENVNKALERDPNLGDAHWILGRIQLRTGAVKDALESFLKTRRLKPGRIEALANMGDAYDELRQLNDAIASYKEAVKAEPESGEWWYRLGSLELDKGSLDESRVSLQEAVLRGDRLFEKPRWLADAHRLYADLLRQSGRTGEALEHYKLFLQYAAPDHPDRPEIQKIVLSSSR